MLAIHRAATLKLFAQGGAMASVRALDDAFMALMGATKTAAFKIANILFHIVFDAAEISLDVLLDALDFPARRGLRHRGRSGEAQGEEGGADGGSDQGLHRDMDASLVWGMSQR